MEANLMHRDIRGVAHVDQQRARDNLRSRHRGDGGMVRTFLLFGGDGL